MIAIVNVSPVDAPMTGKNTYEVRINQRVIATFEHDRKPDGAAQCLRDAADAIDRCRGDGGTIEKLSDLSEFRRLWLWQTR